jgi:FkbM family methyltransferase
MALIDRIKFIYRAYRYRYRLDKTEIRFLKKNLDKGQIVADIGTHKGGYLYWLEKSVGPTGKVYCFEPQRKLFEYLKHIQKGMHYDNIVIENKGISSRSGQQDLLVPKTKSGTSPGAKISDDPKDSEQYDIQKIELVTLDEYFEPAGAYPDVIKIDAEGHEKDILKGADTVLKHCRMVFMECENRHLDGGSVFDVFEILFEKGFSGYFFEKNAVRPLDAFRLEQHQKMGDGEFWKDRGYINNFIFIRGERNAFLNT